MNNRVRALELALDRRKINSQDAYWRSSYLQYDTIDKLLDEAKIIEKFIVGETDNVNALNQIITATPADDEIPF